VTTVRAAADALTQAWPAVENDPPRSQVLRANTATLTTRHPNALWTPDAHPVLFRAGLSLGETGLVGDAVAYFTNLADQASTRLGPDHLATLTTRGNLAHWRGQAGDPAGAATAFAELLTDQLRVLGPDHPGTLRTRSNLARCRGQAGDQAGAATAFAELLTDQLRVLGPDHPGTLTTRDNLAYWRGEAGGPTGAE
jgi:Tetratricopeptide repeat